MKVLFFPAILFFLTVQCYSLEKISLEQAIDLTLKSNVSILKEEQSVIASKQKIREARLIFLPSVYFSSDWARGPSDYPMLWDSQGGPRYMDPAEYPKEFYALKMSAVQPIYTGGRHKKTLELSKTYNNRQKAIYQALKEESVLNVKKNFYKVLVSRKILKEIDAVLGDFERLFKNISKKSPDYPLAAKMLYDVRREKAEAQRKENIYKINLKLLMNKTNDFEIEEDESFACSNTHNLSKILVSAFENRPELKKDIYQSKMDSLSVDLAVRRKYPNIYLGFDYDLTSDKFSSLFHNDERRKNHITYISVSLPINYDFWTKIQQMKSEERANELERLSRQEQIKSKIIESYENSIFYCQSASDGEVLLDELIKNYLSGELKNDFERMKSLKTICELKKDFYESFYSWKEAVFELERNL